MRKVFIPYTASCVRWEVERRKAWLNTECGAQIKEAAHPPQRATVTDSRPADQQTGEMSRQDQGAESAAPWTECLQACRKPRS